MHSRFRPVKLVNGIDMLFFYHDHILWIQLTLFGKDKIKLLSLVR